MTDKLNEKVPEHDVETGIESETIRRNNNQVTWNGPKDSENPQNWNNTKKWTTTFQVSGFTFISPISSTMVAPALSNVARSFGITSSVETQLTVSVFVLAYGLGPLFFGPVSEVIGRVRTLQLAVTLYFAFNLGCGFAQTAGQLIAFRFLSGICGSAPLAIGGGVLADCWSPHEHGKAIAVYGLAPLMGPFLAPIAGAFIAEKTTWRWVFWSTYSAGVIVQICGAMFLLETYAPTLLRRRAQDLRKTTGNPALYTEFDQKTLIKVLGSALPRPFVMLTTQPIVILISVYMGYIFGLKYILLTTFPQVYEGIYGESTGIAGLNYIPVGIGSMIGGQLSARFSDIIYRRLAKGHPPGRPEYRIPLMFLGSVLLPIGIFCYGFSVAAHIHWIMPNIGVVILSAATIICLQCMQTYIIDTYTHFAASGLAAANVLRSLAGFAFPLFALALYKSLGYGWGNGLLAFLGIGVGIPAPFVFWFFDESLRAKSTYATG